MNTPNQVLPPATLERVMEKLGFSHYPDNDRTGLDALYHAILTHIPYDNLRRRILLDSHPGDIPPLINSRQFFQDWLADGVGGTCWEFQCALHSLLSALHFPVRYATSTVQMPGQEGALYYHGTLIADIAGEAVVFDPPLMTGTPLPLRVHRFPHPLWQSAVHFSDGYWCIRWWPLGRSPVDCRLQNLHVTAEEVLDQRETLAHLDQRHFFSATLIRSVQGERVHGIVKGNYIVRHADGQETCRRLLAGEQQQLLTDLFGISERLASRVPEDRPLAG